MRKLDGKVCVVTGGASGIGEATARLFAAEGARVVIADIQDAKGRYLVERMGNTSDYLHTDISEEGDVIALIGYTLDRYGKLDCMFNNAGLGGVSGSIEEIPVEGFDETVGVLFRGVFLGMKHASPVMKRQRSGSIINTASVAGLRAGYGPHVYSAAKAAVVHLSLSVAMELGESGVRVNCICPGYIATPAFGKHFGLSPEDTDRSIEAMKGIFRDMQPIKRSGVPEDVAQAALWLASDDSSFVTGHALVVDGGIVGGKMWSDWLNAMAKVGGAIMGGNT